MQPNIVEGDALLVAPATLATLHRGDVVLTLDEFGLKAHRVVQKNALTAEVVTRGDSGQENDQPGHTALGKVIAIERHGRTKSAHGLSARITAKSNSVLHRESLHFGITPRGSLAMFSPRRCCFFFCLLANVSPAAAQANLSITETPGSGIVSPGANITYTIVVANAGPNSAALPKWVQATPTNTTFVSVTAATGWTCTNPAVGATGNVTCTDGVNLTTAAGTALRTFTLVVKVDAGTAGGTVIAGCSPSAPRLLIPRPETIRQPAPSRSTLLISASPRLLDPLRRLQAERFLIPLSSLTTALLRRCAFLVSG